MNACYRMLSFTFFLFFPFVLQAAPTQEILWLKNGDRLTGTIVRELSDHLLFQHEMLGTIEIKKETIQSVGAPPRPSKKDRKKGSLAWEKKIGAGYDLSRGNTVFEGLHGDFLINRNRLWVDEWTLKGSGLLEKANRDLLAQKADVSLRYAYSWKNWLYHFLRTDIDHDYFQNIQARVLPTIGAGYWLLDTDQTQFIFETGAGYEFNFYRNGERDNKPVLQLRNLISHWLTSRLETGTETYYIPTFADFGDWRLTNETFLKFALSQKVSLKLELENEFRSKPHQGAKKHDLRLKSGIEYEF